MNVIVILCDTLRRDHCTPYNQGRPLNECGSPEAPSWVVNTPNLERLARRGTTFDQAYIGSSPCMPARRDIYTGRFELLERGWGPLEDTDLDLPSQISGPRPTRSIRQILSEGYSVSYLVTDHLNLWSKGSGNYHMGFTGFDFIRGNQEDPFKTDPYEGFFCPENERMRKLERYFRNVHHIRRSEEDYPCAQTFLRAAEWLERNHTYENFFLHIDSFDPHEPWDPPEELVKQFDPKGYDVEGWTSHPPYAKWREHMNEEQFNSFRARYAAKVVQVDYWLGKLLDVMDRLDLWRNTLVIFTTDHGTFNGDHGRIGKGQTHEYAALSHIPFIIAHPHFGHGERRSQLVQLPDIYTTTLAAIGRPIPPDRHGLNLLPVLEDASTPTRDYAISGYYGASISITDGEWTLHQSPRADNQPLYWYGHCLSHFQVGLGYQLGEYVDGRRKVQCNSWPTPTWLSDRRNDPSELQNLADREPEKLLAMQKALRKTLTDLRAPVEQFARLDL